MEMGYTELKGFDDRIARMELVIDQIIDILKKAKLIKEEKQ